MTKQLAQVRFLKLYIITIRRKTVHFHFGKLESLEIVRLSFKYIWAKISLDEGEVGCLSRLLLRYQPSEIVKNGGCITGFSLHDGQVVQNCWTRNVSDAYTEAFKQFHPTEKTIVIKAIDSWRTGNAKSQNISLETVNNQ